MLMVYGWLGGNATGNSCMFIHQDLSTHPVAFLNVVRKFGEDEKKPQFVSYVYIILYVEILKIYYLYT